jgi:hypothetical protein
MRTERHIIVADKHMRIRKSERTLKNTFQCMFYDTQPVESQTVQISQGMLGHLTVRATKTSYDRGLFIRSRSVLSLFVILCVLYEEGSDSACNM